MGLISRVSSRTYRNTFIFSGNKMKRTIQPLITKRAASFWAGVPMGPPDPILGVCEAFKKDSNPNKMNLGVGAYRGDDGKPFVLPSVRAADKLIFEAQMDKEYLGITGLPAFCKDAATLAFADSGDNFVSEGLYANTQTISGTGALKIGAEYLGKFQTNKTIYLPKPSWGNHTPIFKNSGLDVQGYTYYNADGCNLNFDGMIADIKKMPTGATIMLHACAHKVLLAQSFAKNMGLYGERVGAFTVMANDKEEAARIESQLKIIIRPIYSNPPFGGARLVTTN